MPTTIAGALVAIQADVGVTPFILDRDQLDLETSILTPPGEAMEDLTCEVLAANWTWGAPAPTGILTDVTTGRAEITLADPNRLLDPLNDDSPYISRIGNPARILIDGAPAFTGVITNIAHEAADATSVLELADHLSLLHQQAVSVTWAKQSTAEQFTALLDQITWPADLRILYGATTTKRLAEEFVGTAFEAATRLRDAELGAFWADHQGRIAFRARGYPRPTTEVLTLGCEGVAMASLSGELKRIAIVNHVLIDFDPGSDRDYLDAESIAAHQKRSYQGKEADLLFDNL
jgi:hypothetical protein